MPKTSNLSVDERRTLFLNNKPAAFLQPAKLHAIHLPTFERQGVKLSLLRLDQLHPMVSGNKYFKVFNYLKSYLKQESRLPVASFGGQWSNHLHALAAICQSLSIRSIGLVRGEAERGNACLSDLRAMGMQIKFLSRSSYRERYQADFLRALEHELGDVFWIPEGGSGSAGALGCIPIGDLLRQKGMDVVAIPCGTGTSFAGVIAGLNSSNKPIKALGFSALKGCGDDLIKSVNETLIALPLSHTSVQNWKVIDEYHCGGFAKYPQYLADWVETFESKTAIPLDPVYTAKMMYGLNKMCEAGAWASGTEIVAVHTGGLQGRRGRPVAPLGTKETKHGNV